MQQDFYEQKPIFENNEILSSSTSTENIPMKKNVTPPPPMQTQTPPMRPPSANMPPPPLGQPIQTPPLGAPPTSSTSMDDMKNPFKRHSGMSHSKMYKTTSMPISDQAKSFFPGQPPFAPFAQSVNLESLPDNSEHPDSVPHQVRKVSHQKSPVPYLENNEVAPINDRNQYLETGQLSDESSNNMQSDTLPPPGLSRMVLGQMEQNEFDNNAPNGSEEPPPGLSRMVLGQTENSSSNQLDYNIQPFDNAGPPLGLHRMVPGESR